MTRLSRFVLGAALVSGAACSGTPTEPKPAPNAMTPEVGALMTESDTTCRGGFSVGNGKTC
jgi:hypothetical protein